ncbi:putative phosphohydrolase [Chloropicon primus]|nr:putative phosphohydrolase [Chloropicon primus]
MVSSRTVQDLKRPRKEKGVISSSSSSSVVDLTSTFVKDLFQAESFDGSHDWHHILRVRKNVVDIARHEGLTERQALVVEVIALLHDVADTKYAGHEDRQAQLDKFIDDKVKGGLLMEKEKELIHFVIRNMSFKDESKGSCEGYELPLELKVVQDADRLDAIGAVGIARCFMFGGSRNSTIIDWRPMNNDGDAKDCNETGILYKTCVGHFYEKLLKLKGMMKTERGKALAEERHTVMVNFLEQIEKECDVRA